MQWQLKAILQLKTLRKKGKKSARARKVVYYCKCQFQFLIANARTCKGVPFVDLFFAIVWKDFNKEISFFEHGKVLDLVEVCFVFAFEKHAITIKNHSTTIKNTKEEGKKIS